MDKYNLEKIVKNLVDEAIVKEIMSLQLAVKLIEAVEQKALEMGMRVVIALYGQRLSRQLRCSVEQDLYGDRFSDVNERIITIMSARP